ncbi:MAG: hypothetical protein R3C26_18870 [Calditrichia bacterium]
MIQARSQSYIYKYSRNFAQNQHRHRGFARIDIETAGGTSENHAWSGIYLHTVEDAWVRDCTILHFGHSGVYTMPQRASRFSTAGRSIRCRSSAASGTMVQRIQRIAIDSFPKLPRQFWAAQLCIERQQPRFGNCVSGLPHRKAHTLPAKGIAAGARGLLYDNHRELDGPRSGYNPRRIGLYNRGYFGTSHGWSAAHSITWNCDVNGAEIHVQQPPTAQNYAIGCAGYITGQKPPNSFAEPEGYIEGSNQPGLNPRSLFVAQLAERGGVLTVIGEDQGQSNPLIPEETELYQNYPNPFNPTTTLSFPVAKNRRRAIAGVRCNRQARQTLVDGIKSTGFHSVVWEAADMSSGIYFYRLNSTATQPNP